MTTDNHDQFLQELQRIAESTSYPWRMPIRSFEYNYDVWGWQHGARKLTLYPVGVFTFDYFAEDVAAESQSDVDMKLENFKDLWNWLHDSAVSPPSWNYDQLVEDRELFHAFLEENSKIVASWPEWKRNMLGLVVNDADHARLQVPDATVDESHGGSENVEAIAALHQQIRDMPHLSNHPDFRRVYRHLLDTEETQELHTEAERFNRQLNARLEQQFKVDALAAVGLASHPKADQIWTFIDQRCCGPEGGGIHWYTRDVALDSLVALARLMK